MGKHIHMIASEEILRSRKKKKEQSCYIHHSTTETAEGLKILGGNSNRSLYLSTLGTVKVAISQNTR